MQIAAENESDCSDPENFSFGSSYAESDFREFRGW